MDNAALLAFAASLELEFAPLRKLLLSVDTALEAQEMAIDLPERLRKVAKMELAEHALESAMATAYAEGVGSSHEGVVRTTGLLMRADKAFEAVIVSGVLAVAVNNVAQARKAISVRAAAATKIAKGHIIQDIKLALEDAKSDDDAAAIAQRAIKTLEELSAVEAVKKAVEVNIGQAKGYGHASAQQTQNYLKRVQYQELYRAEDRMEWRDWPQRWEEQGGQFYPGPSDYEDGRMIAPLHSSIWEDISAFGSPYPPFDYQSGMGTKPVREEELERLGLKPLSLTPTKLDFNANLKFSVSFDEEIKDALLTSMPQFEEADDALEPTKP